MIVADTKYIYSRILNFYELVPDEIISEHTLFYGASYSNPLTSFIEGSISYLFRQTDTKQWWAAFDLNTKEMLWTSEIFDYVKGSSDYRSCCHSNDKIYYIHTKVGDVAQTLVSINKSDGTYTETNLGFGLLYYNVAFTYYSNNKIYICVNAYCYVANTTIYEPTIFIINTVDNSVIPLPLGDNGGLFYDIWTNNSYDGLCALPRNVAFHNGILYFYVQALITNTDFLRYQLVAFNTNSNIMSFTDIATPDFQDYNDNIRSICMSPDCSKVIIGITNYLAVYDIETGTVEFIKLTISRDTYTDRITYLSDTIALILYYGGENVGIYDFSTNKFTISGEDWFAGDSDIIVSGDTLIFRDEDHVIMYSIPLSTIVWTSSTTILGKYNNAIYYINNDCLVKSNEPLLIPELPQYTNICKLP